MDTVLELMEDAVARYDRKPFLLIRPGFRTRITRYRDLGRIVPRVARVLHDRGLRQGDRAIIWAVNRPEWGITLLGAIHAGVVLVPLDVRSAPDFAAKVAAKTRASLVFASQQTAAQASGLGLPVILIERIPDLARTRRAAAGGGHRSGRPGRDPVHLGHDRRAEGRDADPPQPGVERPGAAEGLSHRSEGTDALGPARCRTSSSSRPVSWSRCTREPASSTRSAASHRSCSGRSGISRSASCSSFRRA